MTREIVALSPEQFEIREVDDPVAGDDEVVIRAESGAAKHGTETAGIIGYSNRGRYDDNLQLFVEAEDKPRSPRPVGNMLVGQVESVGSRVTDIEVGERVVTFSPFRERHAAKAARCWKLAKGMPWQSAVCLDPADFAMGAVRDGHVRVGDGVAVFGMGAIGLMAVQIAKLSGADPVIGLDPLANRREAASHCGADVVLDPADCDAGLEIKKATQNRGADVVIDYSGSVNAIQAALRGVAYGGNVVAGSFPGPYGAGLDFGGEAHLNTPNIISTGTKPNAAPSLPLFLSLLLSPSPATLAHSSKHSNHPCETHKCIMIPFQSPSTYILRTDRSDVKGRVGLGGCARGGWRGGAQAKHSSHPPPSPFGKSSTTSPPGPLKVNGRPHVPLAAQPLS